MKIQRFMTWPLAVTLAGVVGLAGFIIVALAPQTAEAVFQPPNGDPALVCVGKTAVPTTLDDDGVAENIVYTVVIQNLGDATATNVKVEDTLTVAGANVPTFVSSNVSCDKSVDESLPTGTVITCDVSDLAPGAPAIVVVTVKIADPMFGDVFFDSAVALANGPISSNACTALVTVNPPEGENGGDNACTPGFWKNHTSLWPVVSPGDFFNATFGPPDLPAGNVKAKDVTLLKAVKTGGGNCKKLLRHGTAAYLNALTGGFALDEAAVILKIQQGIEDGKTGSGNCQPQANDFGVLNDNKICLVD